MNEEFAKWASESYDVCQAIEKSHAQDGWNARQLEIDALKAENEQLRKAAEEAIAVFRNWPLRPLAEHAALMRLEKALEIPE